MIFSSTPHEPQWIKNQLTLQETCSVHVCIPKAGDLIFCLQTTFSSSAEIIKKHLSTFHRKSERLGTEIDYFFAFERYLSERKIKHK